MIDYFKKHWPVFLLIVTWFIFTWPFWLKGLVPAPLDFLVGFFAPWREHYNIPIKNPAIPDIVNQIIPWKIFTIDQWRQGIVPLWNPYNLAGTPHAANWQSAVFYPANLLPLIFDFITGWSLYILIQPLLAGLFTYLFARSIKLSPLGSLLSALSFSFSGFMTSWLEWGTLGHAILWLPASLWAIEKYLATKKRAYYLINLVTLSLSLLAGHLQVSLYVITVSLAYFYFRSRPLNILTILKGLTLQGVTPFLLVAFQVFPSIELYFHSLRSEAASNDWFRFFLTPVEYLITFVAPDFFGHPVSRNEWGSGSYVEMMGYIGIVPLALALTAIFSWFKKRAKTKAPSVIPFFITLIVLSLLLSLKTPMAELILWLKVPIFASSSPARIIALVSFSLSILGGIGLDHINTQKQRIAQISGIKIIAIGLLLLWLSVLMITFIAPTSLLATNVSIARRNLIIPSFIIILFIAGSYGLWLMYQKKLITSTSFSILNSLFVILLVSGDLYRFHHKFTPYTSRDYWYPNFGIRRTLKAVAQNDRVFGLFDANLNLPFLIKSPEGYDPLLVKNYAELTSAVRSGEPSLPERQSLLTIGKNEPFTMPLLNLLSVKYVIQPTVHGAQPWELHLWEYPDQFELLYDDGNYQIFHNKYALPRFYVTTFQQFGSNSQEVIDSVLRNPLSLTFTTNFPSANYNVAPIILLQAAKINSYTPTKIELAVESTTAGWLYASETWYPGWQAQIDGRDTSIQRANLTFRAIPISPGTHIVTMTYQPLSFIVGILTTAATALLILIFHRKIYVS